MAVDPDKLVDDIYEASFIPDLWPGILARLAQISESMGGLLFVQNQHGVRWTASKEAEPVMLDFMAEGWMPKSTRASRTLQLQHAGFVNDLDIYSPDELEREPTYVHFYRPRGLGWGAGSVIPVPGGDILVFDVERLYEKGPVSRQTLRLLDTFRPHLARAGLASARLSLERAQGVVSTFEKMGLPGAVLTRTGRIVAANLALEALKEQVRLVAFDKLMFTDSASENLYADGIMQCGRNHKAVLSFALKGTNDAPPAVAHLIPIHGQVHDVFARGDIVLLITPLTTPGIPQADVIAALFDLTPAEARVTRLICEGKTAQAIGRNLSLSPETIRTQTKAVLAKVGVRRQIELVRLLAAASFPGPR